jgi:hypothetical protein
MVGLNTPKMKKNKSSKYSNYSKYYRYTGFLANTVIWTNHGRKEAQLITLNDKILCSKNPWNYCTIKEIIKQEIKDDKIPMIKIGSVVVSPNVVIKYNNEWKFAIDIADHKKIMINKHSNDYIYIFIVDDETNREKQSFLVSNIGDKSSLDKKLRCSTSLETSIEILSYDFIPKKHDELLRFFLEKLDMKVEINLVTDNIETWLSVRDKI